MIVILGSYTMQVDGNIIIGISRLPIKDAGDIEKNTYKIYQKRKGALSSNWLKCLTA